MKRLVQLLSLSLPLAALLTAAPQGSAAASTCPTWSTSTKAAGTLHTPSLLTVSTARSTCWDRVTFEFAGTVNGYRVRYGPTTTEGAGFALGPYTAGAGLLNVSLLAPATAFAKPVGSHQAVVLRYTTLRDVVYGGTFEGYTTFAVGTRGTLPFRVFRATGPGSHNRIILDIAHH